MIEVKEKMRHAGTKSRDFQNKVKKKEEREHKTKGHFEKARDLQEKRRM